MDFQEVLDGTVSGKPIHRKKKKEKREQLISNETTSEDNKVIRLPKQKVYLPGAGKMATQNFTESNAHAAANFTTNASTLGNTSSLATTEIEQNAKTCMTFSTSRKKTETRSKSKSLTALCVQKF